MSKRKVATRSKTEIKFWRNPRFLVMALSIILIASMGVLSSRKGSRVWLAPAPVVSPPQSSQTDPKLAKEYIYAGGRLIAVEETVAGGGLPPTDFLATAQQAGPVALVWTPPSGSVDHYEVERRASLADPAPYVFTCAATPCTDTATQTSKVYLYRIRAVFVGSGYSRYSNQDLATTFPFTDDPLNKDGIKTFIRARHFTELREAINAVRTAVGLVPFDWSGDARQSLGPQSRGLIYASHFNDLRAGLGEALGKLGLLMPQSAPVSKDETVSNKPVQELRDLMR